MNFFESFLKKDNLHHAYCIQGNREIIVPNLISFLEKEIGIDKKTNPDIHINHFNTFSIGESRLLKEKQQNKSFNGKKFFIISFSFITREAQNALLKVFEEPSENTHLFLITQTVESLLPTLRSRLSIFSYTEELENNNEIIKFLAKNSAKRLAHIKKIIEDKDRSLAIAFVQKIEEHFVSDKKNIITHRKFLEDLLKLKKYLFFQGSSLKNIMEHIVLTCPRI